MWVLAQTAGTGIRGGTVSGLKGDVYLLLLMIASWALAWIATS